jgi:FKBP-type peptidyl-prolyl cis-trans isomerase
MPSWVHRTAALLGALLFLVTSLTLTILVLWSMHQQNRQNAQTNQAQQAVAGCDGTKPIPAETLPDPDIYKSSGSVSSLEKTDLVTGSGTAANSGDCLDVKYYGTLAANGKKFDTNYDKPLAFQFKLGAGMVIPGWDQGVAGMKPGGTRRLVIPAALGYGTQGSGSAIPPNSDLVFVIKLEKIK